MKVLIDLDELAKILADKGYDGYFHTEGCCAGRLKESISEFLEKWKNGMDAPRSADSLHLSTYLEWNGQDRDKIRCDIRVGYADGKFDLDAAELNITKTDRYGQILKSFKLCNLNSDSFPTRRELIAGAAVKNTQETARGNRGFRM